MVVSPSPILFRKSLVAPKVKSMPGHPSYRAVYENAMNDCLEAIALIRTSGSSPRDYNERDLYAIQRALEDQIDLRNTINAAEELRLTLSDIGEDDYSPIVEAIQEFRRFLPGGAYTRDPGGSGYETKELPSDQSKEKHAFGCLMVIVPDPIAQQITEWTNLQINPVHVKKLSSRPHITIKYGFKDNNPETIIKLTSMLAVHGPIRIKIGTFTHFEDNGDGDVLILSIESPDLTAMNKIITEEFDCVDTHPNYKPHITVAYLDPRFTDSYEVIEGLTFQNVECVCDVAEWSGTDGVKVDLSLDIPKVRVKALLDENIFGSDDVQRAAQSALQQYGNYDEAIEAMQRASQEADERLKRVATQGFTMLGPIADEEIASRLRRRQMESYMRKEDIHSRIAGQLIRMQNEEERREGSKTMSAYDVTCGGALVGSRPLKRKQKGYGSTSQEQREKELWEDVIHEIIGLMRERNWHNSCPQFVTMMSIGLQRAEGNIRDALNVVFRVEDNLQDYFYPNIQPAYHTDVNIFSELSRMLIRHYSYEQMQQRDGEISGLGSPERNLNERKGLILVGQKALVGSRPLKRKRKSITQGGSLAPEIVEQVQRMLARMSLERAIEMAQEYADRGSEQEYYYLTNEDQDWNHGGPLSGDGTHISWSQSMNKKVNFWKAVLSVLRPMQDEQRFIQTGQKTLRQPERIRERALQILNTYGNGGRTDADYQAAIEYTNQLLDAAHQRLNRANMNLQIVDLVVSTNHQASAQVTQAWSDADDIVTFLEVVLQVLEERRV